MSYGMDNTVEDLEILKGARIKDIRIVPPEEQGLPAEDVPYSFDVVTIDVQFKTGLLVNGSKFGRFEIWQDAEGNGPGFLSFTASWEGSY